MSTCKVQLATITNVENHEFGEGLAGGRKLTSRVERVFVGGGRGVRFSALSRAGLLGVLLAPASL